MAGMDFLSAVEVPVESGRKTADIGGSERHIWFGAIYDEARLKAIIVEGRKDGATKEAAKQADRAERILARGNTAGDVEKAFGPLGELEKALPALATKNGAWAKGDRVLVSMTRKDFEEMQRRLKG